MRPSRLRSSQIALAATALFAVSCGSSTTASITAIQATASQEPSATAVATQETELVIVSTPADRGVDDGPVIYGVVSELDDPHRSEIPVEEAQGASRASVDESQLDEQDAEWTEQRCEVEYLTDDLTSNRGNGLAADRMQVVVFYDGDGESSPELRIGLGRDDEVVIGDERAGGHIDSFGRTIETREYQLYGCAPSGAFTVSGIVPNGVVDGLAFAIMWRDVGGRYSLIKSNIVSSQGATYVGMWPLGFSREIFAERTPHITDNFGRETARGMITGAALMPNGTYDLALPVAG